MRFAMHTASLPPPVVLVAFPLLTGPNNVDIVNNVLAMMMIMDDKQVERFYTIMSY